jgi:hypothetical protein
MNQMANIDNLITDKVTFILEVDEDDNEIKNDEKSFNKKIRKPRFEKSNMYGIVESCKKLYEEVKQWNRIDESDTSPLKGITYGMGYTESDLIFHGWEGESLRRERAAINAVVDAAYYLQNVLEDVLGIESEEYISDLRNDECGRYKLIDTKKLDKS